MGWDRLPRRLGRRDQGGDIVTVSLQCLATKRRSTRIVIIVGAAVSQRLGWAKGQHLAAARGSGTDAGDLRLAPVASDDADAYSLASTVAADPERRYATRIAIAGWPSIPPRAERARAVKFRLLAGTPGTLVLTLPLWAGEAPAPGVVDSRRHTNGDGRGARP